MPHTRFRPSAMARLRRFAVILIVTAALLLPGLHAAKAQDETALIRDAEIEKTIRIWVTPIFKAAGLDPKFVQIYLVNDSQINSFVAGGQRIFINTGLLTRSQTANQVIGVLAHETGHIAGGHLLRMQEALKAATAESIAGFLLGGAAAVAGRDSSGMLAGVLAGESMAQRSLFAYSINQEGRADQAAVTFLDDTHQSARGFLQFFEILSHEEALLPSMQDPYLRTHPLTQERIDYVRHHVETSPYSKNVDPPEWQDMHDRMVAKLKGFLLPPSAALKAYPVTDQSIPARYARAIAWHRIPMDESAVKEMDSLLRDEPRNPWFHELRGQILFEGGHATASLEDYRESVAEAPDEPLLRIEFAEAMLEASEDSVTSKAAEAELQEALRHDDQNPDAWHFLGIAQGRLGDIGDAALDLAEEAVLSGDNDTARGQADKATQILRRGSPGWLKADDIRSQIRDNIRN